jgi:hypothetical protein
LPPTTRGVDGRTAADYNQFIELYEEGLPAGARLLGMLAADGSPVGYHALARLHPGAAEALSCTERARVYGSVVREIRILNMALPRDAGLPDGDTETDGD